MQVREFSGDRLQQARLRKGLTQTDLAHALRNRGLKTTGGQIWRWESGEHTPRASMIPMLADELGISMDELYGLGDDEEGRRVTELIRDVRASTEIPLTLRLRVEEEILRGGSRRR